MTEHSEAAYAKLEVAIATFLAEAQEASPESTWIREGEILGDWVLVVNKESIRLDDERLSSYSMATSRTGHQSNHRTAGLLQIGLDWTLSDG